MKHTDENIPELLEQVLDGRISKGDFLRKLERSGFRNVGEFARIDVDRRRRTGIPEIIYAPGKEIGQILDIVRCMVDSGEKNILVSRTDPDQQKALLERFPQAVLHEKAGIVVVEAVETKQSGDVAIVTAGTSDLPVAEEAAVVCRSLGSGCTIFSDVGIAGLHRILAVREEIAKANVVICIAGMEAALPSVVAGLVQAPVIAVPGSAGYGVNTGGWNALLSVLGGCVPGVVVVNIDNGTGAAVAAHRINMLSVTRDEDKG